MFVDLIGKIVEVYVDDMLVKSSKVDDRIRHIEEVFQTLWRYIMRLNSLKCAFRVVSKKFLAYVVNQRGIEDNPDKIKALIEMDHPKIQGSVKLHRLCGHIKPLHLEGDQQVSFIFQSPKRREQIPMDRGMRRGSTCTEEAHRTSSSSVETQSCETSAIISCGDCWGSQLGAHRGGKRSPATCLLYKQRPTSSRNPLYWHEEVGFGPHHCLWKTEALFPSTCC